jgi:hypothetical protein
MNTEEEKRKYHDVKGQVQRILPARQVTLDFCHGSNGGTALYLNCQDKPGSATGHRVAGPKCWGLIQTRHSFKMSRQDLEDMIEQARIAIKFLGKS